MRRIICVGTLVGLCLTGLVVSVSAQPTTPVAEPGWHQPPVEGPVLDPFRPPDRRWEAGNRGIEYETVPGTVAVASADGVVVFAGPVGGSSHVTIRHGDDLVTTIAFVEEVLVVVGERVAQGHGVAVVGESVHFTARRSGTYIDPETLFRGGRWVVRLVTPRR